MTNHPRPAEYEINVHFQDFLSSPLLPPSISHCLELTHQDGEEDHREDRGSVA